MSALAAPLTGSRSPAAPGRRDLVAVREHLGIIAAALGLWALTLGQADVARTDDLGLLGVLPLGYYVAIAVLVGGFALAVTRRELPPGWVLAAYVVALVAVLHGTAPLLYDEPRYAWTYKHLAVTDLIAATGHIDRSIDIYNNWPGFFALAAWLQRLSGVPMIEVAGWAQVAFELLLAAAVHFSAGAVTADRRRVWLAVWLFLLGSWVGADYFAPQSLAFVFAFVLLGIVLRATEPRRAPARLRVELDAGGPAMPRSLALLAGTGCWLALLVTHQLTPVLVLAAVLGLCAVRRVPLWVPAAMLVTELAWVALAWDFLREHFALFDAGGVKTPDPQAAGRATPMAGVGWAALGSRVVTATIVLLAGAGAVATLHRSRRLEGAALALVVAPCLVVPLQAYGGEGVFRAYVFALPWLALLGAGFLLAPRPSATARALRVGVPCAVVAAGLLVAFFGLEQANRMTRDDVAAARWYEATAGDDSLAVVAAANLPSPISRRYVALGLPPAGVAAVLADYPQFTTLRDGAAAVRRIAWFAAGRRDAGGVYVLLTGSQRRYAELYGIFRPGFLDALQRALGRSPLFRRVYATGESDIYKYIGPRGRT